MILYSNLLTIVTFFKSFLVFIFLLFCFIKAVDSANVGICTIVSRKHHLKRIEIKFFFFIVIDNYLDIFDLEKLLSPSISLHITSAI